jgi:hypothetical protein
VTDHSYHNLYEKYLPAYRDKKVKMLEIGLGCGMSYGPASPTIPGSTTSHMPISTTLNTTLRAPKSGPPT